MKPVAVATVTKSQAKRLLFFFTRKGSVNSHAGRNQGRHKLAEPETFQLNGETKTKYWDRHNYGRQEFFAPTTDGATYLLEWSLALRRVTNNAPVCVQLFFIKPKFIKCVVSLSQHITPMKGEGDKQCLAGDINNIPYNEMEEYFESFNHGLNLDDLKIIRRDDQIMFSFNATSRRDLKFHIRKDDITPAAWEIWHDEKDVHKYDLTQSYQPQASPFSEENRDRR